MNEETIIIKLDGDAWCAHRDSFTNLQESNAAFGDDPVSALIELLKSETPPTNCSCHISPPCSDCIEHSQTRAIIETYAKKL